MSIVIREYQDADRPELVRCITQLLDEMGAIDPLGRSRRATDFNGEKYVEKLLKKLKKVEGMTFFAEEAGKIVGCVVGGLIIQDEDDLIEGYPSKQGRVFELWVDGANRGQKVGLQLMQAIEEYFKKLGCEGCLVECFAPNKNAHEFYEKLGYTDRNIDLRKSL